ncbi:hypothetical protein [Ferviditalea candida]|uniref:Uncharacterized protein n=1 Tax=Ferviditalea candida TaxID=3108399 RepID=A0ABU5ZKK9_9BACL|nr:hypothetical protein [Paenibacillaceae bacterium T2]
MNVDRHITEIMRLRRAADELPDDIPHALMEKIELLAKCMVFVGRLSSFLDGEYKRIYAERKRVYAESYVKSKSAREATAELSIVDHRKKEAQAYEDMHRWRNAFEAMQEEIHALKLKMRIDFADGTGDYNVRTETSPKTKARA